MPDSERSVAVAAFADASQAQQAVNALTAAGARQSQIGLLTADQASPAETSAIDELLARKGVPEGERRFYANEVNSGRALVVVDSPSDYTVVRELILKHGGYDVQSRGAELARAEGAGVPGGTGPRPIDVTGRWEDVVSRYEMLWQQHYGTSDATWDQTQPVYRYAWSIANQPQLRGRPWSEVEGEVRHDWESTEGALPWADVAGPIRDVWEDVAADAATFAEGGLDRNIPSHA